MRDLTVFSLTLALLAGCASTAPPEAQTVASAEPLAVDDMQGTAHDLSAALARGERVALVFWQTWCGPCRREAPAIARAARDSSDRLRFYGVVPGRDDTVDDAKVAKTAGEWGYTFPQIRDRDLALSERFNVFGTPTVVVLGPGLEVLYNANRPPERWADYEGETLGSD